MKAQPKRRAGQPIIVFFALLLGWVGIRALYWESPFPEIAPIGLVSTSPTILRKQPALANAEIKPGPLDISPSWKYETNALIAPPPGILVDRLPLASISATNYRSERLDVLASHQLLWLSAMTTMPLPRLIANVMRDASIDPNISGNSSGRGIAAQSKRWSVDGWLFLRPDATLPASTGPRFASYGASQAGALLRYRLRPDSAVGSTAYLRATKALAAGRESELAAGLSARLIPSVPIAAHAELRATRGAVTTEVRPAAFLVTEFPPQDLPADLQAETYFAAGYVGGDFATAFVDGQIRVDRELAQFDRGTFRAGAGVWGGAQKRGRSGRCWPKRERDYETGQGPGEARGRLPAPCGRRCAA